MTPTGAAPPERHPALSLLGCFAASRGAVFVANDRWYQELVKPTWKWCAMKSKYGETLVRAFQIFTQIDGTQAAAAFANYAFFSLFPLLILFVTVASFFVNREQAGTAVLGYLKDYVPITGELQASLFETLTSVIKARGQASLVAVLFLTWGALQFFTILISSTNRAWGFPSYNWWQLPLKSLAFLIGMAAAVLLGVVVPISTPLKTPALPLLVVFFSVSLLYRFAPRQRVPYRHIWPIALIATVALQTQNSLFMVYITSIVKLNVVYGAFGVVMALLLWIYFSGSILIFGACLCAVQNKEDKNQDKRMAAQ